MWSKIEESCHYLPQVPIVKIRTILQRESQNLSVYKKTKSVNNQKTENRNDPDLVQAFLKKWWVESDFIKAPNLPRSLRLKDNEVNKNVKKSVT
jgi:hypothetical protein